MFAVKKNSVNLKIRASNILNIASVLKLLYDNIIISI